MTDLPGPDLPDLADLRAAQERIAPHAHVTPIVTSRAIDAIAGATLLFKCENLQRVGAFKFRGATNALFSMSDAEAWAGVATHSSGNHAQAIALAAKLRGVPAHIVMPADAPAVKRRAVEGYGGRVIECEATLEAREATLARVVQETGAAFVHPYDDVRVIAGQGTVGLELLEQAPDIDALIVPVGGGGLMSGVSIAVAALAPQVRMLGAEPELADDAARGFAEGRRLPPRSPVTVADGLRTALSDRTFAAMQAHVAEVATVSEAAIVHAMRLLWERTKLLVEASSAVPLAAVLEGALDVRGQRVAIVLTGGNVDLDRLPWMK